MGATFGALRRPDANDPRLADLPARLAPDFFMTKEGIVDALGWAVPDSARVAFENRAEAFAAQVRAFRDTKCSGVTQQPSGRPALQRA